MAAGLLCADGVVIASDSAATTLFEKVVSSVHHMRKIELIEDRIVLAVAGPSGVAQQYSEAIRVFIRDERIDEMSADEFICVACRYKGEAIKTQLSVAMAKRDASGEPFDSSSFQSESLIAVRLNSSAYLFRVDGSIQPERVLPESPFVVVGSGAPTTHAFLEYLRQRFLGEDPPDLGDGILALLWAVRFAKATGAQGVGGPPQVTVVPSDPASPIRQLTEADIAEHEEVVTRAEASLGKLRISIRGQVVGGDEAGMPE